MFFRESSRSPRGDGAAPGPGRILVLALVLLGIVARLLPYLDPPGRMLRQFPSEDGYLMLTIARSIALGLGMSTADGTIPTNGTQPFATMLYALGFVLVGADRVGGVALALGFQALSGAACALVIFLLARRLGLEAVAARRIGALAGSVWFASSHATLHGMNCLETGFYALGVVGFAWAFLRWHPVGGTSPTVRQALWIGLFAGLLLWVRLDGVFLVVAACCAWAFLDARAKPSWSVARAREAVVIALAAGVVISPWLVHNHLRFGSIMPISGQAQAVADVEPGTNLVRLPVILVEYLLLVFAVPASLEKHPAVVAASLALCVGAAVWSARSWKSWPPPARVLGGFVAVFAAGLCLYYGRFFGVPYFLSRYLFPLSVFSALILAAAMLSWVGRFRSPAPGIACAVLLVGACAAFQARIRLRGMDHLHFQVVEWVEEHVADADWIGAIQTGTVGFFHDRTINLDGKVNPHALVAVRGGRVPSYVLETPIRYLADWEGLAEWADIPELRGHFELVVHDRENNLAVLARRD